MAKSDEVSFFEQHIEKFVLGACALFLLYAMGHWVFGSPEEIEVPTGAGGTRMCRPGELDESLLKAVEQVKRRKENIKPTLQPLPPYQKQIKRLQNEPSVGEQMADLAVGRLAVKDPGGAIIEQEKISLSALQKLMPRPGKPLLRAVRLLPNTDQPRDIPVVIGAAVFPWDDLFRQWSRALQKVGVPPRLVVRGVEVEVEELLPDGKWGRRRTVDVVRVAVDSQGRVVRLKPEDIIPAVPAFTGDNAKEVREALDDAGANLQLQKMILQPDYYNVWWSPTRQWVSWQIYLPRTEVSEMVEASEEEPSKAGTRREKDVRRRIDHSRGKSSERTLPPRMSRQEMLRRSKSGEMLPPEPGRYQPPRPPKEAGRPKRTVVKKPTLPPDTVAEAPQPVLVPDLAKQKENGKVLVWFIDDSADPNRIKRYRLKVKFFSPILAEKAAAEPESVAKVAMIATSYSDWSDPAVFPMATEFFLTGASPQQAEVKVTVFARSLGQRVQHNFAVKRGMLIGGKAKKTVPNPATGQLQNVVVDFSTGAVAVDFDFAKSVLDPKGGFVIRTVEMLYVNQRGKLRSRTSARDGDSKKYKELLKETKRAATVISNK